MKIFNVQINGCDAKWFCKLAKSEKISWIKENTNQQDEKLIQDFLLQPMDSSFECGCGCGDNALTNKIPNLNESSRISKTVVKDYEVISNSRDNSKLSTARRKKPKNT